MQKKSVLGGENHLDFLFFLCFSLSFISFVLFSFLFDYKVAALIEFVLISIKPSECDSECIIKHEDILVFLNGLNVSIIDLREKLTDSSYYELDGHLNKKGNEFVFKVLRDELY